MREQLVLAAIGLIFLGSAAIGKPLIYQLARARTRRRSPAEARAFEAVQDKPAFRRAMMTMTLVWGISLVIETALACSLIFVLSIEQRLLVSPIMGYSAIGADGVDVLVREAGDKAMIAVKRRGCVGCVRT